MLILYYIVQCPGKRPKEVEKTTDAQFRLAQRRQDQQTKEWAKIYNSRAGIEGSIGASNKKREWSG